MDRSVLFSLFCVFSLFAVLPVSSAGKAARENAPNSDPRQTPIQNQAPEQEILPGKILIFTGVAGRLSHKEEAIQAALRDAARRLSFFHSVSSNARRQEHIGGKTLDYRVASEYQLIYDEDLDKFLDMLEFDPARDVFENNNAVFVVTRISSEIAMPNSGGYSAGRERPAWIDMPPSEINGFIAGVGYASRFSSHKDTVIASYEDAVVEIIYNTKSVIKGETASFENSYSAFGTEVAADYTMASRGTLYHFYIVETWTDPANLGVWTLAVANKENIGTNLSR
jgi:hypothetical protein